MKRITDNLVEENQVKWRKLGQRAHRKVESGDDEFIVKCFENKVTPHGRRHDSVLYLKHRVEAKAYV